MPTKANPKKIRQNPRYLRGPFPVSLAELYDCNINPWKVAPQTKRYRQYKENKENLMNQSLQSDLLYPDLYASGAKRTELSLRIKSLLEKEQNESHSSLNISQDIRFAAVDNLENTEGEYKQTKLNKLQQIIEKQKQSYIFY